jgi:tetratricopeptide (TPR) repeat protein
MSEWWTEETAEICEQFQLDLSCLVDGELDESAAGRAMLHVETCGCCREFFEDTRRCMRLHLDATNPERLLARISSLTGHEIATQANTIELVHKLATIFYQLGKAYVLTATDPGFRMRVFENAVPIEPTQTQGRGFVDGVVLSGKVGSPSEPTERGNESSGVDWKHARGMLNGRLKDIESPLEKGRRLLEEAIAADPSHEEARLYMAFLNAREGKRLQAAEQFRDVFDSAMCEANRGHAAVQLGLLYETEGDHRRALTYFRWVAISGLEAREPRFFFVLFNIGLQYALLGDQRRSLHYFRSLLDRYPDRLADVVQWTASSQRLREALASRRGFAEAFARTCHELFNLPSTDGEES